MLDVTKNKWVGVFAGTASVWKGVNDIRAYKNSVKGEWTTTETVGQLGLGAIELIAGFATAYHSARS